MLWYFKSTILWSMYIYMLYNSSGIWRLKRNRFFENGTRHFQSLQMKVHRLWSCPWTMWYYQKMSSSCLELQIELHLEKNREVNWMISWWHDVSGWCLRPPFEKATISVFYRVTWKYGSFLTTTFFLHDLPSVCLSFSLRFQPTLS